MELIFFFTVTLIAVLAIIVNAATHKTHAETIRKISDKHAMEILAMSDRQTYSLREFLKRQREL